MEYMSKTIHSSHPGLVPGSKRTRQRAFMSHMTRGRPFGCRNKSGMELLFGGNA